MEFLEGEARPFITVMGVAFAWGSVFLQVARGREGLFRHGSAKRASAACSIFDSRRVTIVTPWFSPPGVVLGGVLSTFHVSCPLLWTLSESFAYGTNK